MSTRPLQPDLSGLEQLRWQPSAMLATHGQGRSAATSTTSSQLCWVRAALSGPCCTLCLCLTHQHWAAVQASACPHGMQATCGNLLAVRAVFSLCQLRQGPPVPPYSLIHWAAAQHGGHHAKQDFVKIRWGCGAPDASKFGSCAGASTPSRLGASSTNVSCTTWALL